MDSAASRAVQNGVVRPIRLIPAQVSTLSKREGGRSRPSRLDQGRPHRGRLQAQDFADPGKRADARPAPVRNPGPAPRPSSAPASGTFPGFRCAPPRRSSSACSNTAPHRACSARRPSRRALNCSGCMPSSAKRGSGIKHRAKNSFGTAGGGAGFSITYQEPKWHIILLWFVYITSCFLYRRRT